jgi:endogenous inhibitor of DNA gyrase (YacG/DUF329 family)
MITRGTICGICGKPIQGAKASALRPFVRNAKDPLYPFSGRAFHASCFESWPEREHAVAVSTERVSRMASPQTCTVCGERILDQGYSTDLLTTVRESPLYKYNYLSFHAEHWSQWSELGKFEQAVEAAGRSGLWEGCSTVRILG